MVKLVINIDYGGFNLSYKGLKRYYELKYPDKKLYLYKEVKDRTWKKVDESKANEWWCTILSHDFGDSFKENESNQELLSKSYVSSYDIKRNDPCLIQVVEELGEEANGSCANLKVVTIDSDKYRICEYDGAEWVETPESIEWETA